MNKTFNINLGSYPFAIDEDALRIRTGIILAPSESTFQRLTAAKRYYMI
ncbi:MAG: hypothetical protein IPP49_03670 [Saprospiraceae bacterium]|nr:hypothetical protein [Saprospiraceae bacterium]